MGRKSKCSSSRVHISVDSDLARYNRLHRFNKLKFKRLDIKKRASLPCQVTNIHNSTFTNKRQKCNAIVNTSSADNEGISKPEMSPAYKTCSAAPLRNSDDSQPHTSPSLSTNTQEPPKNANIYPFNYKAVFEQGESSMSATTVTVHHTPPNSAQWCSTNLALPSTATACDLIPNTNVDVDRPTLTFSTCRPSINIPTTDHQRRETKTHMFGGPNVVCFFCNARMWNEERVRTTSYATHPIFSLCCKQGMIRLPPPKPTPGYLLEILNPASDRLYRHFRDNIRLYNSLFQFTSLGGRIDNNINNGSGPYIFRLNGQTHHRIGSLLPNTGEKPAFAQLYIYDTANEISNRVSAISGNPYSPDIDRDIVENIIAMLNENNEIVKHFRIAADRYEEDSNTQMRLRLLRSRGHQQRNYASPTSSEIAALIVGDIGMGNGDRDIIVQHKSDGLQRISILHPLFMSMQYPLLFPHGEDGYTLRIPFVDSPVKEKLKRKTVSMREYYAYQIQTRYVNQNTLLRGGRLFQQFITDAFSATEEDRLHYIRNNQKKLRADMYKDVRDAMQRGDVRGISTGKRVILPASFTGSSRYLFQNYQDALAICRYYSFPDLFITFTCNAQWPEIHEAVHLIDGQRAEDRPDIVARVFRLKLAQLLKDLMKKSHFGPAQAVTYTIEFQKRGLPHVHLLLWLQHSAKLRSVGDIDKYVSAEIPDPTTDPIDYQAVTSFMMHGPCGSDNLSSPCMIEKKCSKFYPKKYQSQTTLDEYGYAMYRRRDDTGKCCRRNNIELDNRYVVPHNVDLIVRYQAHINVEVCNQTRAIKYLFKYINKGPDRAHAVIENDVNANRRNEKSEIIEHDEIKTYLDCRYLSAYEASWRLFSFPIHHRKPAVLRLPLHLPDQQNVYFTDTEPLHNIFEKPGLEKTMFTQWMVANQQYEGARELLYADFPTKWVWHKDAKQWRPRTTGKCIGRLIYINPAAGELYYLRLLLNIVRGARCYEEIRTINGVIYPTFQAACEAAGLLGDDKEWREALTQASSWATSKQLRELFLTILLFCEVVNAAELFEANWRLMSDDIELKFRRALNVNRFSMPDSDLRNYVLVAIEELLIKNCSSLDEKKMPHPSENLTSSTFDRIILEELNYNRAALEQEHSKLLTSLNPEQKGIYEVIKQSVDNKEGKMLFVYGHGGTGKTYLWKTMTAGLRASGRIVLAVASSGIASLLLPGGRTAHSRFKIPITIDEWSTCEIKKGTQLARLLQQTSLILWDEAPMVHRFCIEALQKTLKDILIDSTLHSSGKPFGGITIVFGGDFRQILPVIQCGTTAAIVDAAICNSSLWKNCEIYTLKTNMRLLQPQLDKNSKQKLHSFANWLLKVGDGKIKSVTEESCNDGAWITIPQQLLINTIGDPFKIIFESTYTDFVANFAQPSYLRQRAIVTPYNNTVDQLNTYILGMLPGPTTTYHSYDSLSKSSTTFSNQDMLLYPPEVLNSISLPGVPNHVLELKIGAMVMLLRNISQINGLCNGTRLLITHLASNIIEATVITGEHLGEKVFIPRIVFSVENRKWPFVLSRKQFPLRLSYAMTINKSQGQTLDFVGVYLPKPVFTHGQLYVALSRVTSSDGLKILIHDDDGNLTNITKNVVYKQIFDNI